MNNTKFGFDQFWKNTPDYIKRIRTGMQTFIAGSLIFMEPISRWTGISTIDLDAIFGITLLVLSALLSMFGVKDENEVVYADAAVTEPTPAPGTPTPPTSQPSNSPGGDTPPVPPIQP